MFENKICAERLMMSYWLKHPKIQKCSQILEGQKSRDQKEQVYQKY